MESVIINAFGREVNCIINKVKKPKCEDLVILTGAGTIYRSYIPLIMGFKNFNTIVIHTPLHGTKKTMTKGPAISSGKELVEFQKEVIKSITQSGICTEKINVLGYSLGGMTLFRMLENGELKDYIRKAVFMNTAPFTKQEADYFIKLAKENIFLSVGNRNRIKDGFNYIAKNICQNIIIASKDAYIADALCVAEFDGEKEKAMGGIEIPSLYIASKNDNIFPVNITQESRSLFRACSYSLVGGDHKAYIIHAGRYSRLIDDFLLGNSK